MRLFHYKLPPTNISANFSLKTTTYDVFQVFFYYIMCKLFVLHVCAEREDAPGNNSCVGNKPT